MVWSSFSDIGITFAIFKLLGKVTYENNMFPISDIH